MRQKQSIFSLFLLSPSSRRAWIEIPEVSGKSSLGRGRLHREGSG